MVAAFMTRATILIMIIAVLGFAVGCHYAAGLV